MRRSLSLFTLLFCLIAGAVRGTEAIVVVVGDQHSAYERVAQFVAHIDRLKRENPGVPFAILINGDSLEYGNVVARRTSGAIDFAMFTALAQRAPTIVNLGNHEPEFHDVPETVRRLEAAGVKVVSGNLRDRTSGKAYAQPSVPLKLGTHEAIVVGVTTDQLSTYRAAIRPHLDLSNPAVWARENFGPLLKTAAFPIVLSHSGLRADREMLSLVPDVTLFAGAHDHLRFVHQAGDSVYFHSGSWMEFMSIARLKRMGSRWSWDVEQTAIKPTDPADPVLAKLVRETIAQHLTPEENVVVGRLPHALGPTDAARFAVEAARLAAGAEVALIGATTFGAGLPSGEVTRYAFDACVRFDGTLFTADIDGEQLTKILRHANQGPDTPFAERAGENLIAVAPAKLVAGRSYRFVTTDWVAKNAVKYLGENPPALTERTDLKLKAAVVAAMNK
jgi:5'-nucleotidase / UDP-sugar diphosphatase